MGDEGRTKRQERAADYQHRWRIANPDKARAIDRRYREKHSDRRRSYWEGHREELAIYQRRWVKENCERVAAIHRRYAQENPEKMVAKQALREARKKALPDTLTPEQAEHLLRIGQAMYPGEKLALDHIVPISKGGGTTWANTHFIPRWLNLIKHTALPSEAYEQCQIPL